MVDAIIQALIGSPGIVIVLVTGVLLLQQELLLARGSPAALAWRRRLGLVIPPLGLLALAVFVLRLLEMAGRL